MTTESSISVTLINLSSGEKQAVLLSEGSTIIDLLNHPDVHTTFDLDRSLVTVNSAQATTDTVLKNGDKVAVTPTALKAA